MKRLSVFAFATAALIWAGASTGAAVNAQDKKEGDKGWVQLFNGKDLTGWKTHPKAPGQWEVKDGAIVGSGEKVSHLFSERDDYENFRFRIEAKISDKGNSGQYIRTQFGAGYPKGYEVQINSTHSDTIRTGSLYPAGDLKLTKEERAKMVEKTVIKEQLHQPDEWFTQEIVAEGNHIQIFVNGKKTVDYLDPKNTYTKGHFAIQGHDAMKAGGKTYPTIITVRKIEVLELPATKK
jgi:Domain of Unknown Function (DUF1080)